MMRQQQPSTVATGNNASGLVPPASSASAQDDFKMSSAELRYEAPLATFDTEEWNEFLVTSSPSPEGLCDSGDDVINMTLIAEAVAARARDIAENNVCSSAPARGGGVVDGPDEEDNSIGLSGSLEDLVNTFDAKITKCFRNYNEHTAEIAPVQIRTQEELLADSQSWWTITGNLTTGVPGEWIKNYTLPVDVQTADDVTDSTDQSRYRFKRSKSSDDDDDTSYQDSDDDANDNSDAEYDVTRSSLPGNSHIDDEPVATADEVISEIESMMEGTSPVTSEPPLNDVLSTPRCSLSAELLRFTEGRMIHPGLKLQSQTKDLERLSLSALTELTDELHRCIHDYSAELVGQLALRDELDFDKELKNQFIWLLLRVQKRRREAQLDVRPSPRHSRIIASGYLNTVIPYDPSHGAPSTERLQIYIKILSAINEDNSSVPSLLTDYILKGNNEQKLRRQTSNRAM